MDSQVQDYKKKLHIILLAESCEKVRLFVRKYNHSTRKLYNILTILNKIHSNFFAFFKRSFKRFFKVLLFNLSRANTDQLIQNHFSPKIKKMNKQIK